MRIMGNIWVSIYQRSSFSPGLQSKKVIFSFDYTIVVQGVLLVCICNARSRIYQTVHQHRAAACSAYGFGTQKVMPCKQFQSSRCKNSNVGPQVMILKFSLILIKVSAYS